MTTTGQCNFTDVDIPSRLRQKRKLGLFVLSLLHFYKNKPAIVSYTFVSDAFLFEMNQTHLQHDDYTDIITFDLSEKKGEQLIVDIYISVERVKENATLHGVSYATELLRVILHGALHIAGFGDKTPTQKKRMRAAEDEWMQRYETFVP
ncbi:MAG TPA: rRNA maturation RNase YbeY [Chitinophagaceae bacterium]|nr:rRNA maturation RNase YbeY [Chitinophagaceae bacterium]